MSAEPHTSTPSHQRQQTALLRGVVQPPHTQKHFPPHPLSQHPFGRDGENTAPVKRKRQYGHLSWTAVRLTPIAYFHSLKPFLAPQLCPKKEAWKEAWEPTCSSKEPLVNWKVLKDSGLQLPSGSSEDQGDEDG